MKSGLTFIAALAFSATVFANGNHSGKVEWFNQQSSVRKVS